MHRTTARCPRPFFSRRDRLGWGLLFSSVAAALPAMTSTGVRRAQERQDLQRRALCLRVRPERGRRPPGDTPRRPGERRPSDAPPQALGPGCFRPSQQRRPPSRRACAHHRPRTHVCPHLCRRQFLHPEQRQRVRNRARRVEATRQRFRRPHRAGCPAGDAAIPPDAEPYDPWPLARCGGTTQLPLTSTVPVQHQPASGRSTCPGARRTSRRAHMLNRGIPVHPFLDADLTPYDFSSASCVFLQANTEHDSECVRPRSGSPFLASSRFCAGDAPMLRPRSPQ
jgi:hypothetical protein